MVINETLQGSQIDMKTCTIDFVSEKYVSWLNDKKVNRYLETRYIEQTLQTVKEYVEKVQQSDNEILLGIIARDKNEHIGNVHVTIDKRHKRAVFGYMIGNKAYWGRNIGVEAIKIMTKWVFDSLDVMKIEGAAYSRNTFSIRTMLNAGYKREGVRLSHVVSDDGERDDVIEVGLLREDYEKLYHGN